MSWKRIDRVQRVEALLCRDFDFLPILERLKSSSKLYQDVEFSHGERWCVFFGYTHESGDIILPHLPNAVPFYQMGLNVWLPVGVALDIVGPARENYLDEIRKAHTLGHAEIFMFPKFTAESDETNGADIFTISENLTVGQVALEPQT